MKPIEELGISPAPWKNNGVDNNPLGFVRIIDKDGFFVADVDGESDENQHANAHIIAAAPKMYEELWKICFGEMPFINCRICQGAKLGNCKSCSLGVARAVLAVARGEEVSSEG